MNNVSDYLQGFQPVSLKEMDRNKLMNRIDSKFIFPEKFLEEILSSVKNDYFILEIDGKRVSAYESLYFDTKDFSLFDHHQRGKLNRYKIRFRRYVQSGLTFFEVKYKNNKGRTDKKRIEHLLQPESIEGEANAFLKKHSTLLSENLEPKLWVNYHRITLVNKNIPERVTIDTGLTFISNNLVKDVPGLVIAEVKQERQMQTAFMLLMKKHHIRQGSISKYCFAVSSLYNNLRINSFKPRLNYINKLIYAATGA